MFITATEVTQLSNISASAGSITDTWIDTAEDRLNLITNNYFVTNMYTQSGITFTASSGSALAYITTDGDNWSSYGFADGDIIHIGHSYRNDGYYQVSTVGTSTMTLVSGSVVQDELSGASIIVSVTNFPRSLKYTLAQMIKYDYDDRRAQAQNLRSKSLGPWSETYTAGDSGFYGYPQDIIAALDTFTITRVV